MALLHGENIGSPLTAPRPESAIPDEVRHRIKTYIGSTSAGWTAENLSWLSRDPDKVARMGNLIRPKCTDTKQDIVIASLWALGYTQRSISECSVELFGKLISESSIRRAVRRVLLSTKDYNKHFLRRRMAKV